VIAKRFLEGYDHPVSRDSASLLSLKETSMPQPPVLGLETKHIHPGVNRVKVFGDFLDTGIDHTGANKPGFHVHVDVGSSNHTWTPGHHPEIPPGQRDKHWIWVEAVPTRNRSTRGSRTDDDLTVTVTFDDNGQQDSDTVKFCDVDFASLAISTAARNQPPVPARKKAPRKKPGTAKAARKKSAKVKSAKVKKPRKSRR